MIFVIADDKLLDVLDSEADAQGAYEGIDVEDGMFQFFDESGAPLVPEFYEPNQRSRLIGRLIGPIGSVISGRYRLVPPASGNRPRLIDILDQVVDIEQNTYFASVDEVRGFLTTDSRRAR